MEDGGDEAEEESGSCGLTLGLCPERGAELGGMPHSYCPWC